MSRKLLALDRRALSARSSASRSSQRRVAGGRGGAVGFGGTRTLGGRRHSRLQFRPRRNSVALIRQFSPAGAGNRGRVHGEVECGFSSFESRGRMYLQLDTYGSQRRVIPGKVSQTIQLDVQSARELKRLLERTFPGI
jgi:hypothetical protein